MIAFLDTSAIVPLLIEEGSSQFCRRVWDAADAVVCSQLAYVEAAAALSGATRLGRVTVDERTEALARLDRTWEEVDVMAADEPLIREAAALTLDFPLRGSDAVHCAAALRLADLEVTAVSGDHALLAAWSTAGIATIDIVS
jgi:predicted nucleic acid-binding protein